MAFIAIFVAGLVAGWFQGVAMLKERQIMLRQGAVHFALAFSPAELSGLEGAEGDSDTVLWRRLKQSLLEMRDTHPALVSMTILRHDSRTGSIVCLVGTEMDACDARHPEHDATPREEDAVAVSKIVAGAPTAVDLYKTRYGIKCRTSYAPIGERSVRARGGVMTYVVRYDVDSSWAVRETAEGVIGVVAGVWLLFGLPLAVYRVTRRHASLETTIRKLSEAVDKSATAIVIVNHEGKIEYANTGFCKQVGYTRAELMRMNWSELRNEPPSPEEYNRNIGLVRSGMPWVGEWIFRRKNGEVYAVSATVTPVYEKSGIVRASISIITDITERRAQELDLQNARKRAEAAVRAKSVFLATMSHEVRTPLNGIVGFSTLLLDAGLAPEQQARVEGIRKSSEFLAKLTSDIMDISLIESGKLQIEPVQTYPTELIEGALEVVADDEAARSVEFLHEIAPDVPQEVLIDGARVQLVLVNLARIAIQHASGGVLEISLRLEDRPAGGQALLFSVRASRLNVLPEKAREENALDGGYQPAQSRLAIVRQLVHLLGGELRSENEPQGDAPSFCFALPFNITPGSAAPFVMRRLAGFRVAVQSASPGLQMELARELQAVGAATHFPAEGQLSATAQDWDLAVIDCDSTAATEWERLDGTAIHPGRAVGLVGGMIPSAEQRRLRAFFPVLRKPLCHATLINQLVQLARVAGARSAPEKGAMTQR